MALPGSDKLGDILPQRQLIRNGEKVTAFCLGGYHLGLTENPGDAEQMIERSLEPPEAAAWQNHVRSECNALGPTRGVGKQGGGES